MRFSAIHPRIVTAKRPEPAEDETLRKKQDRGDRFCCCGFIVAGVTGYVFMYWFLAFGR